MFPQCLRQTGGLWGLRQPVTLALPHSGTCCQSPFAASGLPYPEASPRNTFSVLSGSETQFCPWSEGEKEDKDVTLVHGPQMDAGHLSWPFLGPDLSPIFWLETPHSAPMFPYSLQRDSEHSPFFLLSKQGNRIPTNFRGKPTMCKLTDSWNTNQDHFLCLFWWRRSLKPLLS